MKRIYLDYAATTPVDPVVFKAMQPYFSEGFGNPGSLHSFGQAASRAVFLARRTIAQAIGADYREIIFTGSATEANNLALRGIIKGIRNQELGIRSNRPKNSIIHNSKFIIPRIIVSAVEHESVLETTKDLEKQDVEVIYLPVSREGFVDLEKLQSSLNERTVLVSIMYANNEIGTIQPISEIAQIISDFRKQIANRKAQSVNDLRLALSAMPLLHTDAVQALQYLDCGVNNLKADLMTISAHKIYGPKGIGALYVRGFRDQGMGSNTRNHLNPIGYTLNPIITGGGQESGLRSGTENIPSIVGFAKAVELVIKSRKKESLRIRSLRDYFWGKIRSMDNKAELNGVSPSGARLPNNLNVHFPKSSAQDLLIKLDLAGIAVSAGSACSSRATQPSYVLKALGLDELRAASSLRFTLGRPTTKLEIDKTLKVIKNLIANH